MTELSLIELEVSKALSLLKTATDLMKQGKLVKITSLKPIATQVCDLMQNLDDTQFEKIRPLLIDLMDRMDLFCKNMENRYTTISEV